VNLPNRLTISRILLVPFILLFMLPVSTPTLVWFAQIGWDGAANLLYAWDTRVVVPYGLFVAGALFLVAALTDTFDGAIARKRGIVTTLGKFLDPIADKILVSAVLIALVQLGRIGSIGVIVVLLREFVVSALRMVASDKGIVIAAGFWGKVKMVLQIVAILLLMFQDLAPFLPFVAGVAFLLAVLVTLYSGVEYVVKHAAALVET
jgi:CDP-diacylglycerol---glycerol-3-phosphate 3-phosphatidyltransferase